MISIEDRWKSLSKGFSMTLEEGQLHSGKFFQCIEKTEVKKTFEEKLKQLQTQAKDFEEPVSAIDRECKKYKENLKLGENQYLKSVGLRQSIEYFQGHGINSALNEYINKINKAKQGQQQIEQQETVQESEQESLEKTVSSKAEDLIDFSDSDSSYVMPSSLLEDADLEFDPDSDDEIDQLQKLQDLHKDLL